MARVHERVFAWVAVSVVIMSAGALSGAFIIQEIMSRNTTSDASDQTITPHTALQGTPLAEFSPVSDVPKLQSRDTKVGSGQTVKAGDTVVVDYTGAVAATGLIFQSSLDSGQPATLSLNSVIEGWKLGIVGMKVGGERRLVIPASEAYGSTPPSGSGIPADAALVFDITLHSIQ